MYDKQTENENIYFITEKKITKMERRNHLKKIIYNFIFG